MQNGPWVRSEYTIFLERSSKVGANWNPHLLTDFSYTPYCRTADSKDARGYRGDRLEVTSDHPNFTGKRANSTAGSWRFSGKIAKRGSAPPPEAATRKWGPGVIPKIIYASDLFCADAIKIRRSAARNIDSSAFNRRPDHPSRGRFALPFNAL